MRRSLSSQLSAALLALGLLASAGTQAESPRVGLVLAGGGARGLAHIGVIKYLEERGVRVQAIAGTSMGAIIGGLYASGLTASELEAVARGIDWRYAFDDSPPRDQIPFRRKEEDFDFLVGAQLRFKDGRLRLPMGAIEGQHLNFVLHDLVAHASRIRDFDELPIPYRAVAADIVTGEAVVLSKGDLALAMRASMSIPVSSRRWSSKAGCSWMAGSQRTFRWMSRSLWGWTVSWSSTSARRSPRASSSATCSRWWTS